MSQDDEFDIRILLTNEATGRAKNILLPNWCLAESIYQCIYDKMAIRHSKIRRWPRDLKIKLEEQKCNVACSVLNSFGERIVSYSEQEMKETKVKELIRYRNDDDENGVINLVLHCERVNWVSEDDSSDEEMAQVVVEGVARNVEDQVEESDFADEKLRDGFGQALDSVDFSSDDEVELFDPTLSKIEEHYDKSLDELKASLLQFQTDLDKQRNKGRPSKKHRKKGSKHRTSVAKPSSSVSRKSRRVSRRDETFANLKEFQVNLKEKIQTPDELAQAISSRPSFRDETFADLSQFQMDLKAKIPALKQQNSADDMSSPSLRNETVVSLKQFQGDLEEALPSHDEHSAEASSLPTKQDLHILLTNEATGRSKNIVLPDWCLTESIYQCIYDKMAIRHSRVREWSSELQAKLDDHQYQVMCSVLNPFGERIYSYSMQEMKGKKVKELVAYQNFNSNNEIGVINLVLHCEKVNWVSDDDSSDEEVAEPVPRKDQQQEEASQTRSNLDIAPLNVNITQQLTANSEVLEAESEGEDDLHEGVVPSLEVAELASGDEVELHDRIDPTISQIEEHYDKPLEELKASLLEFHSDMSQKKKPPPKEIVTSVAETSSLASRQSRRVSKRDETFASLKQFQANLMEKIPTADGSAPALSSRSSMQEVDSSDEEEIVLTFEDLGRGGTVNSESVDLSSDDDLEVYDEVDPSLSQIQDHYDKPFEELKAGLLQFQSEFNQKKKPSPKKLRTSATKFSSLASQQSRRISKRDETFASLKQFQANLKEKIPTADGSSTVALSRPSLRDETFADLKQFQMDLKKKSPSRDQTALTIKPSDDEKPLSSSSSRDQTLTDLKQFQTKLAEKLRGGNPTDTPTRSTRQYELANKSLGSPSRAVIMSSIASPEPKKRLLPTQRRISELEHENKEMTRSDLLASLLQFQSQFGGNKNHKSPSPIPAMQLDKARPNFARRKATRHNSLDLKSPTQPKRNSLNLKPVLKAPKYSSMPQKQAPAGYGGLVRRMSVEDRNFRKWFESKMEQRIGARASERYILEEDDTGEFPLPECKSGNNQLALPHQKSTAATATVNKKEVVSQQTKDVRDETYPTKSISLPRGTRTAQIELQNKGMSRDEIKASFLQFQSQMKFLEAPEQQPAPEQPPSPSNDSANKDSPPRERVSQFERENEQMSRTELTASLLQFQSKIHTQIPPSVPKTKEVVAHDAVRNPNGRQNAVTKEPKPKVQLDRGTKIALDRAKLFEERETTPRNEMIAKLKQFQVDLKGRIGDKSAKKRVNKLSTTERGLKSSTESTYTMEMIRVRAANDHGMEVTEDDYLTKIEQKSTQPRIEKQNKEKSATRPELEEHFYVEREAILPQPPQDMATSLFNCQPKTCGSTGRKSTETPNKAQKDVIVSSRTSEEGNSHSNTQNKKKHPRKFESMLKNLEELKKRNEEKVSSMQNLDRKRKENEEKVSAMISALSPEEATETPSWFAEFVRQQEDKFQELMLISEQRKKEIKRLNDDSDGLASDEKKDDCSQTYSLEHLQTGEKTIHAVSESHDQDSPRHIVRCTPYECHMGSKDQNGESPPGNSESASLERKLDEAIHFLKQFSADTGLIQGPELEQRLEQVKNDIARCGIYSHNFDELEYGCRLAWRNSAKCIMRSSYSSLAVRDCRQVNSADECFNQCVWHLKEAFNGGNVVPVISIFKPKSNGESDSVRIWNRELLAYAAYLRNDGTVIGDPANLEFTALCTEFGWTPPEEKSDFDVLPWLISDQSRGLENPKVFSIPNETVEEVELDHPDFDLFGTLNLRWHALSCTSNVGVNIGGVCYQLSPFSGCFQATDIARNLLDSNRYNLAEIIAAACDIRTTRSSLWKDDAQLQAIKAIMYSFGTNGVVCVDHHSSSESFLEFFSSEMRKRGNCPADWTALVSPAAAGMTSVFHQEMFNFMLKPQYQRQLNVWDGLGTSLPEPLLVDCAKSVTDFKFDKDACLYDHIYVYYGSETGRGLRMATLLIPDFGNSATGPIPLDSLPDLLKENVEKRSLVVVVTSTLGSGKAPFAAKSYIDHIGKVPNNSVRNIDFALLGLGNSAYTENFATFAQNVEKTLRKAGCNPAMGIQFADDLKDPDASFGDFREKLLDRATGVLYEQGGQGMDAAELSEARLVAMTFESCVPVLQRQALDGWSIDYNKTKLMDESWDSRSHKLGRPLDLFRFKIVGSAKENVFTDFGSGDHIALYPPNMSDVVESVLRHVDVDDKAAAREYLKEYKDLSMPLGATEIFVLRKLIRTDQDATKILDEILSSCTASTYPSIERLVQILPPGSLTMQWILKYGPAMDPRFFSIASLDKRRMTVTIVQSVYSFYDTHKAGVTSRWLRSLSKGDKAMATFATTKFQLPQNDEGCPILLISTGSGIAPCRTFWLSGRKNPTYLFCGCRSPDELPFATEIDLLEKKGLLHPYIAYSRVKEGKMRLEAKMRQERSVLLGLLHNPKTRVYLCGSPELESTVRSTLVTILAQGDKNHQGLGMVRSMDRLALMVQSKRFVSEVYGSFTGDTNRIDPMFALWQESTTKMIRNLAALEKFGVPIGPPPSRRRSDRGNPNSEKERQSTFAYNPKISGV